MVLYYCIILYCICCNFNVILQNNLSANKSPVINTAPYNVHKGPGRTEKTSDGDIIGVGWEDDEMRVMVVSSVVKGGSVEQKPPEPSEPTGLYDDDFLPRGAQCSEPDDDQQPQTSRQTLNLPGKVLQISWDFNSGGEFYYTRNISSLSLRSNR